ESRTTRREIGKELSQDLLGTEWDPYLFRLLYSLRCTHASSYKAIGYYHLWMMTEPCSRSYKAIIPRRRPITTASVRSEASSFSMMCLTWTLTVPSLMASVSAMSAFPL